MEPVDLRFFRYEYLGTVKRTFNWLDGGIVEKRLELKGEGRMDSLSRGVLELNPGLERRNDL